MSTLLPEEGFFTVNYQEAELKRTMLKCGKEKIIALDSSKVGKTAFSFVADFMLVDKLITDSGIVPKDVELLEKNDIEVIVV
jgi:DeoR/GlpR family transcriptional regulator of sugar metabolism